jgi:transposase
MEGVMFVESVKNGGKDYLRLAHSVRVTNKDGYKVSQKKVVLNIGPVARYDDGLPNYIERLKKSFKAGVPLIPMLEQYCENVKPREKYRFTFEEGDPNCIGEPKLFSHLLIERIIEELGLLSLFGTYKGYRKIQFDVYGFVKLLIFGRLLNPASKIATVRQNDDYYDPVLTDFNPDNVYDTLDFVAKHKDAIIRRMNSSLVKKAHRRPEIIYYDVTNFYFEIENPDADILDEDGNVCEKGLRKMGVSKESRKQPIVQMGLFVDDNGIPIGIESFPGNTLDHLTMIKALKNNIDDIGFSRFIMVGDRGISKYNNLLHLSDAGHGYIVAKSILKSKGIEQEWIYDDEGYIHDSNSFKYKSRIVVKKVKDETGTERIISELEVAYWSEKFAKRQIAENKSFLEFIEKLLENPTSFRINKTQSKSIRQYLRKEVVNDKTGEVFNSSELKAMLDMDKIERYKKNMGYYLIISSELDMHPKEVIDKYHGLSRIEDQFRVMKGDLDSRPFFVRTKDHINAHLLICMIALIVMRIIQNKVTDSGLVPSAVDKKVSWTTGLSAERVQVALNKWEIEKMPGDLYRFLNVYDTDLKTILDAFKINIPCKMFRRGELRSIKTSAEVFM